MSEPRTSQVQQMAARFGGGSPSSADGGLVSSRLPPRPSPGGESIVDVFRRFDKDNSGAIDLRELLQALNALGLQSDEAGTRAVMARYDTDGNGTLELPEFRLLVTEIQAYQKGASAAAATPPAAVPASPTVGVPVATPVVGPSATPPKASYATLLAMAQANRSPALPTNLPAIPLAPRAPPEPPAELPSTSSGENSPASPSANRNSSPSVMGTKGTLKLLLKKGVGLKAADLNGKSDPYVDRLTRSAHISRHWIFARFLLCSTLLTMCATGMSSSSVAGSSSSRR